MSIPIPYLRGMFDPAIPESTITAQAVLSGNHFNHEVSDFGSYQIEGTNITGTVNKVTGYTGFDEDPEKQEGLYICIDINPWEGTKVYKTPGGSKEQAIPLKDNGIVVARLGKDSVDVESLTFIESNGAEKTYTISVTKGE